MAALGLLLLAVGAIVAFAFNMTLGIILIIVGAVGILAGMMAGMSWGFRTRRERVVSPDGSHVYEDSRTTRF